MPARPHFDLLGLSPVDHDDIVIAAFQLSAVALVIKFGIQGCTDKNTNLQPEPFDGAYLLTKYSKEYDMPEIPAFVKKGIMPLMYLIGKALNKYPHFKDAPVPLV